MQELMSKRMAGLFMGLMLGGIGLTHVFEFFGLHSVSGTLIGGCSGMLIGYLIGRKTDLKECSK